MSLEVFPSESACFSLGRANAWVRNVRSSSGVSGGFFFASRNESLVPLPLRNPLVIPFRSDASSFCILVAVAENFFISIAGGRCGVGASGGNTHNIHIRDLTGLPTNNNFFDFV